MKPLFHTYYHHSYIRYYLLQRLSSGRLFGVGLASTRCWTHRLSNRSRWSVKRRSALRVVGQLLDFDLLKVRRLHSCISRFVAACSSQIEIEYLQFYQSIYCQDLHMDY